MPYTKEDLIMHFTLDELHTVRTNAGSLEGAPPIETTMKIVEREAKEYFFDWPYVVIPPEVKEYTYKHPIPEMRVVKILPQWTHFARFTGPSVKDKDSHGTILGIIWFDNEPQPKVAEKEIILQVDWDKHAKDFWY